MAGVEASAAKAAASGGEEYVLTPCHHHAPIALRACSCTTKRKAGESTKGAGIVCSESKSTKGDEEKAPAKKKSRLPQKEVDHILNRVIELPPVLEELKLQNPDLMPSPEEELDPEMVEFYEEARLISGAAEKYKKFQARVRRQYRRNGYVELEDDFLARVEAAKEANLRDLDDDL